jgi:hypothetical protein
MENNGLKATDIGDDEPITLAEACRLFFGGRLSPSALRTEAAKGNLEIMQIARKDFVTRRAIRAMMLACTRPAPKPQTAKPAQPMTAQEALRLKLKQPARPTDGLKDW